MLHHGGTSSKPTVFLGKLKYDGGLEQGSSYPSGTSCKNNGFYYPFPGCKYGCQNIICMHANQ